MIGSHPHPAAIRFLVKYPFMSCMAKGSMEKNAAQPPPQSGSDARASQTDQGQVRVTALRVQLPGLGERISRRANQAKRLLALSQLQPEEEMARVQFHRLLQKFEGKSELLVVIVDPSRQPANEPFAGRQ